MCDFGVEYKVNVLFEMTDNTRRIVTLLKQEGPLSKKDLAAKGSMGWATVTKIINQLEEGKIIERLGTEVIDNGKRGKRAYLYDLSEITPTAIGVDVEYRTTSIILTNLKGTILASWSTSTVIPSSLDMAKDSFLLALTAFMRKYPEAKRAVGIGMGIPGIGFPIFDELDNLKRSTLLETWLSKKLDKPVIIQDNTKAYAIFERWNNTEIPKDNFIFLSIRSGVGSGIFYHGNLLIGTRGLAGEIGHIQVKPEGEQCRCGRRGCLETVVGENTLFNRYVSDILDSNILSLSQHGPINTHEGIKDLFRLYEEGDEKACEIVNEMLHYVATCLSYTIMVLDIPHVLISGHFGASGNYIVEPLKRLIDDQLLPGTESNIQYIPFDPLGHVLGASLLALKDYFINVNSRAL